VQPRHDDRDAGVHRRHHAWRRHDPRRRHRPDRVTAERLRARRRTGGCATRRFSTYVDNMKKLLARVIFKVDGKVVGTVRKRDKQGRFLLIINPPKHAVGTHKLTLTLVPKSTSVKARTIDKPFKRSSVCTSRGSFLIHLKKVAGERLRSATIYVDGKRVKVLTGKRMRSRVTLTGLASAGHPQGPYPRRDGVREGLQLTRTHWRRRRQRRPQGQSVDPVAGFAVLSGRPPVGCA
jgi:hypothetical protein